jgi:hypothetical protein
VKTIGKIEQLTNTQPSRVADVPQVNVIPQLVLQRSVEQKTLDCLERIELALGVIVRRVTFENDQTQVAKVPLEKALDQRTAKPKR